MTKTLRKIEYTDHPRSPPIVMFARRRAQDLHVIALQDAPSRKSDKQQLAKKCPNCPMLYAITG